MQQAGDLEDRTQRVPIGFERLDSLFGGKIPEGGLLLLAGNLGLEKIYESSVAQVIIENTYLMFLTSWGLGKDVSLGRDPHEAG